MGADSTIRRRSISILHCFVLCWLQSHVYRHSKLQHARLGILPHRGADSLRNGPKTETRGHSATPLYRRCLRSRHHLLSNIVAARTFHVGPVGLAVANDVV